MGQWALAWTCGTFAVVSWRRVCALRAPPFFNYMNEMWRTADLALRKSCLSSFLLVVSMWFWEYLPSSAIVESALLLGFLVASLIKKFGVFGLRFAIQICSLSLFVQYPVEFLNLQLVEIIGITFSLSSPFLYFDSSKVRVRVRV